MRRFRTAGMFALLLLALFLLPAEASAARISQSSKTIRIGQAFTLRVSGTGKRIKWSSSKSSVATVSSGGVVRGKKAGKAVITAKAGRKKFTCNVTVRNSVKKAKKIQLGANSLTMYRGETAMLSAVVKPDSANQKVSWKSSNSKVVSVTKKGKLRAKKTGSAVITVKAQDGSGATAKCKVKVEKERTPLVLSAASLQLRQGEAAKLSASVDASLLVWGSSNGTVATVAADGTVTGIGPGSAQIVAMTTDGSQAAICDVAVIPVEGIPSASAQSFLGILKNYSEAIQNVRGEGRYFAYSNSSSLNQGTWDKLLNDIWTKGIGYTNCAHIIRLALIELGKLREGQNFWGTNGTIHFGAGVEATLRESCDILYVNKSVEQLMAENALIPGDICIWTGMTHTNVYAGKDILGQAEWYDAGRWTDGGTGKGGGDMKFADIAAGKTVTMEVLNADAGKDSDNKKGVFYVFNSFGPHGIVLGGARVAYIIRLVR